jgi:outer membrane protein assembly factor BamA
MARMARDILGHGRAYLARRPLLSIFAVALLAALAFPAQAQDAQSGSGRLESIAVTGSAKFRSDQIAPASGLKPGDQITRDDIQKGADNLANLGPFSDVRYRFSTTTSGVQIQYQVSDAPSVSVFFDNFPWFTDEDLIAAIKGSVHLFDGTAPERGLILDDLSNALVRHLQAHGITANVSHELVTLPWNQQKVVRFEAEGATPVIQSIEFTDSLANVDHAISDRISDLVGKPFSRSTIETFEFEQVRPVYLAHSFLRVKFGEPSARVEANTVVVRAPIDIGPAFIWNGVTWSGNQAIPSAELTKLVDANLGGPANGMRIQGTWENIRNAFEQLGYLDVSLDPIPHFDDAAKRVSYEVKITEGPQYHMGNLVLTGLSTEGEHRIRSAWKIAPGAVFDDHVYEEFLNSGIRQAFAGLPVHYEKIGRFLDKHPADGKIDVMLDFQ